MSGVRYLLRRLALTLLVLLGALTVTFAISHVIPGDPARLYLGARTSDEAIAAVRADLGLDAPLPLQFVRVVSSAIQGEFGYSYRTKRPIIEDLAERLSATMELVLLATFLVITVGVSAGVLAVARFATGCARACR